MAKKLKTTKDWDDAIKARGIDHKESAILTGLIPMYTDKLKRLKSALAGTIVPDLDTLFQANLDKTRLKSEHGILKADLLFTKTLAEREAAIIPLSAKMEEIDEVNRILHLNKDKSLLTAKIARIEDNRSCCSKELDLRDAKLVNRVFHHTIYYIDLDGGNDGLTGLSTAQS